MGIIMGVLAILTAAISVIILSATVGLVIKVISMTAVTWSVSSGLAFVSYDFCHVLHRTPQARFHSEITDSSTSPPTYAVIFIAGDEFDGEQVFVQTRFSSNSWAQSGGSDHATIGDSATAQAGARIVYQDPETDRSILIGKVPE